MSTSLDERAISPRTKKAVYMSTAGAVIGLLLVVVGLMSLQLQHTGSKESVCSDVKKGLDAGVLMRGHNQRWYDQHCT